MVRHLLVLALAILALVGRPAICLAADKSPVAVVCARGASFPESLAAREVRRYVYARTGACLPIVDAWEQAPAGSVFVVGSKDRPIVQAVLGTGALRAEVEALESEQYVLKTLTWSERPVVLVVGGDPVGTLYGAYRLAEHLGVRFYLHGDVVPDRRVALSLPQVEETGRPLFDRRGIQPFHDFPEGPDWWRNADAYKAVLGQLPKLRMNFFGLHCYSEGRVGPEPAVWIGRPSDLTEGGKIKASYPARHFATSNVTSSWGYVPMKTSDYAFGAGVLFERDDYGPDYLFASVPWVRMDADQCNAVFERFGDLLHEAFTWARHLGIKTCIGTETPLVLPAEVRKRLEAEGKDPKDARVVQEVYEAMFRRIAATHPLDYYWFWTPEGWTWRDVKQSQIDATVDDLRAALAAHAKVKPPFRLATCGWVLGPPQQPALFDRFLPKPMPMSCINRNVGHDPVEPGFARVAGRPKWAIPWLEDDPAMIIPQLWVGRMRKDAADAYKYGCTGLLGIHWRTRILGPNVAALAAAAWDQKAWNPEFGKRLTLEEAQGLKQPLGTAVDRSKYRPERYLACDDFYRDWARSQFGPDEASEIAELFGRIDCRLPRPSTWVHGPGGIRPDARPWEEVAKQYAFVDELAALRSKVEGAGNQERFDFWLNQFRYLRAVARLNCIWARLNASLKKVEAASRPEEARQLARDEALPIRIELIEALGEVHRYLLDTVTTPGLMGNVANWQQHVMPMLLGPSDKALTKLLGRPLPDAAMPGRRYPGEARVFVPVVRTALVAGEPLRLDVIVVGAIPTDVSLFWRRLGEKRFRQQELEHIARGVYRASLNAESLRSDFEYYVQACTAASELRFPATAPALNQTVVVVPRTTDTAPNLHAR